MQTNPYAAPAASVADPASEAVGFAPAKVWTLQGRIGRLRLIAYGFAGGFLLNIASAILVAVAGFGGAKASAGILLILVYLTYALMYIALAVRRAHDLDWSGYLGILALVPLVNLIFIFLPGTRGANRFGLPPPPNGWGVRILALFLPVVALVGIVAAIAIPQYQAYKVRAQQSQGH